MKFSISQLLVFFFLYICTGVRYIHTLAKVHYIPAQTGAPTPLSPTDARVYSPRLRDVCIH